MKLLNCASVLTVVAVSSVPPIVAVEAAETFVGSDPIFQSRFRIGACTLGPPQFGTATPASERICVKQSFRGGKLDWIIAARWNNLDEQ
jgi:hypothetical protein